MSFKKRVGSLIPYRLIEVGRRVVHFGPYRCEICAALTRGRLDSGYGYPVLEKLCVVGGMKRRRDRCPVCHSGARERLICFYLGRHHPDLKSGKADLRIAHFAPEKGLSAWFRAKAPARYAAYDFQPGRYRHMRSVEYQNLEALTLSESSVDLLVCNHVMEHVFNLEAALAEVSRVLKRDGLALMQVPIALRLDETRDGGQNMGAIERIDQFGQDDHVRLFSLEGYIAKLEGAGFEISPYNPFDEEPVAATEAELDPLERLFLIRRAWPERNISDSQI